MDVVTLFDNQTNFGLIAILMDYMYLKLGGIVDKRQD